MDSAAFLRWGDGRASGHYELVRGEVVAMAPERVRHNVHKLELAIALRMAVRQAALDCTVFTDGVSVVIDAWTTRIPDASVQCGSPADPDALSIDAPIIVCEVVSPSSERQDLADKLAEYFALPSVRHYLIVSPERPLLIHHRRDEAGRIETAIRRDGELVLDPPGLRLAVADLLPRLPETDQ